jgi:hypothetical protein
VDCTIAEQKGVRDIVGGAFGDQVAENGDVRIFTGREAIPD